MIFGNVIDPCPTNKELANKGAVDKWERRRFQAFFWVRVFSCSQAESTPAQQMSMKTGGQVELDN
jgi:hypothetical protein